MADQNFLGNEQSGSFRVDIQQQGLDNVSSRKRPRPSYPVQRAPAVYERRRAPRACLVCRARKTKCDNRRPACGFCVSAGGECIYPESDTSKFDRASLAILDRISQLESTVLQELRQLGRSNSNLCSDNRQQWRNVSSYIEMNGVTPSPEFQTLHQHSPPAAVLELRDAPPPSDVIFRSSEMTVESLLKWPIFTRLAPDLEPLVRTPAIDGLSELSAGNGASSSSPESVSGIIGLDYETVQAHVENFLTNNLVKNPILDVDILRADARVFSETGPQWDGRSCLILLVCAVSAISSHIAVRLEDGMPFPDSRQLAVSKMYFQAAQRRIGMLYHENSLVAVQCAFLTGVYLMSTMQILAAWKCFVQAGTQCFSYLESRGLMRKNRNNGEVRRHNSYVDATEQASQHRPVEEGLYWSCLKSELELRIELSLAGSALNEVDYPHVFPSPPTGSSAPAGRPNGNASHPLSDQTSPTSCMSRDQDTQTLESGWFFYLSEIALRRIVNRYLLYRYQFADEGIWDGTEGRACREMEKSVAEFDFQIKQWLDSLPAPMRFPTEASEPTNDILLFVLRGHMIDVYEMVRFPAIRAYLTASRPASTQLSPTCIRLAKEALANAVYRIETNSEGLLHRHQGTWLTIRSCTRSALILLGTAIKCRIEAEAKGVGYRVLEAEMLPDRWKSAVLQVLHMLEVWSKESGHVERLRCIIQRLLTLV
ncbi:hypothetical protein VTO42DRAFT_5905 [Malbranchea cinnamomea]